MFVKYRFKKGIIKRFLKEQPINNNNLAREKILGKDTFRRKGNFKKRNINGMGRFDPAVLAPPFWRLPLWQCVVFLIVKALKG